MSATGFRALAGIVSAGAILGVAEIVAAPISAHSAPLVAVGDVVVKNTPLEFERWAIERFGTADKLMLFITMIAVSVIVAAVAGIVERRRRPWGSGLFVVFGIASALAALDNSNARWTYALPALIAVPIGIALLRWQLRALDGWADEARTTDRRIFLGVALGVGVGAAILGIAGRVWGAFARDVSDNRAAVRLPTPPTPVTPAPAGADLKVPGLASYITDNSEFYLIDTALVKPQVSTDDWSLRIHGLVDQEITLSWADLSARKPVEKYITLCCVSNPVGGSLIGNAKWLGYPLKDLLEEAGVQPGADMVLSTSEDGWTAGSPLEVLLDGRDAMLAIGMNGEPLPIQNGFPARLVVPGLYGYVSATKWVRSLEVTRFDRAEAYWTKVGWSARGPIKTACRIDTPTKSSRKPSGLVAVAGVAWAQHRGISAVEVQVDDGPWQKARLADDVSIDTWRQWVFEWDAQPGNHTLRARATDGTGEVQTAEERDVVPDGASGWPACRVAID
ncbi:molybdopterin-dependent oxidoreductase [Antrihabitans sp. YC2-6]|uniref:molybdopterin-dependent oxidoreductase n=1 Tax=Antrihabitans sp. YC2-6 TaxID=2799498 RepID=UPI0018F425F6|nr:molybdopterin-dependent oxidoreductase [Antrihabitans sp. YC2-6]MBJ8343575.1 molybdopterin-dependent oxidoreductase [Antrihabitans sp. YC2-6]